MRILRGLKVRVRPRRSQGATLMEMLLAFVLVGFLVAGSAQLFNTGNKQQRLGRSYSQAQNDLRGALRIATRAFRHAFRVQNPSQIFTGGQPSNGSQLIVLVPDPNTTGLNPKVEMKFYLSEGTLYKRRSDENAPGTPLITGISSLAFNYFNTLDTTRTAVDGTPSTATEVLITVTAVREGNHIKVSALTALRNRYVGSI